VVEDLSEAGEVVLEGEAEVLAEVAGAEVEEDLQLQTRVWKT
jgi:hypothetical protein